MLNQKLREYISVLNAMQIRTGEILTSPLDVDAWLDSVCRRSPRFGAYQNIESLTDTQVALLLSYLDKLCKIMRETLDPVDPARYAQKVESNRQSFYSFDEHLTRFSISTHNLTHMPCREETVDKRNRLYVCADVESGGLRDIAANLVNIADVHDTAERDYGFECRRGFDDYQYCLTVFIPTDSLSMFISELRERNLSHGTVDVYDQAALAIVEQLGVNMWVDMTSDDTLCAR